MAGGELLIRMDLEEDPPGSNHGYLHMFAGERPIGSRIVMDVAALREILDEREDVQKRGGRFPWKDPTEEGFSPGDLDLDLDGDIDGS